MKKIFNDITETVGRTPLVRLNKLTEDCCAEVAVKLEYFNPMGSVKDRIALNMIKSAEDDGRITEGSVLVEPTSGNTGVGLAFVAASRGYKLILTMPDTMSEERRLLLRALGAQIVLTPGAEGMTGAIEEAKRIVEKNHGAVMLQQFENPANPEAHRKTTAVEIWEDSGGEIDIVVAGVGTGGTLTGCGEVLKSRKPDVSIVAVEPDASPVLSTGKGGPHKIQGIGAGFVPSVLNTEIYDRIIRVKAADAGETARRLAKEEGIFGGISAGANVCAALDLARREENRGKLIVTVICDTGERYLSTWLYGSDEK